MVYFKSKPNQLAGETVTLSFDEGKSLHGNFGRLLGFLELPDGSVYNADVIEDGEALVALDTDANVAAIGGPLIEERFGVDEGGPGVDQYGVYPFLTNVIDELGTGTGPVAVDGGHGQFVSDFAVSAADTASYLRYLEGQAPGEEEFVDLEGVVDLASDDGPDLLGRGTLSARALKRVPP